MWEKGVRVPEGLGEGLSDTRRGKTTLQDLSCSLISTDYKSQESPGGQEGWLEVSGQDRASQAKATEVKVRRSLWGQQPRLPLLTQGRPPALHSWSALEVRQLMGDSGYTPGPHTLLVQDHMGLRSHRTKQNRGGTCCGGELPQLFS